MFMSTSLAGWDEDKRANPSSRNIFLKLFPIGIYGMRRFNLDLNGRVFLLPSPQSWGNGKNNKTPLMEI